MAGWHHQLDGHKFEWTPEVGDGQGGLTYCDSWGYKESDMTEWLNKLNWSNSLCCYLTFPPSDILRAFRPSLHPMYADHTSLFNPCSLLAVVSVRATSQLGVLDRCVICGFFFFFFFPSQLCCPLRFQNSLQPCQGECFVVFRSFSSFTTPFPGCVSVPNSFLSLYFIFCPTSFQREWADFLGAVVLHQRSAVVLWNLLSVQMIFQWICGGQSGLPSYSSAILGSPPNFNILTVLIWILSLVFMMSLLKGVSVLFIFSKNHILVWLLLFFYLFIFHLFMLWSWCFFPCAKFEFCVLPSLVALGVRLSCLFEVFIFLK